MFDYESINNLSAKDVEILNGLLPLAEEAKRAEEAIKAVYCFSIGEDKIEVWGDEYNHEYITHDGTWQARYLHQSYDVKCTAEEIFQYLKASFLIKKGFAQECVNSRFTKEGEMTHIFAYFERFMKDAVEKAGK